MRDLQECQAEVFRRSEQRIKARKHRRNCIVALCVPLVLCLAVAVTYRLARGENGSPDGFTGGASQENYESFSVSMDNVKVSGPDFTEIYTEPARVLQICEQLQTFSVRPPEDNQPAGSGSLLGEIEEYPEQIYENYGSVSSESAGYTLVVTKQGKTETEYYFQGNMLKDLTAEQTYSLTAEQAQQLRELLGISDP